MSVFIDALLLSAGYNTALVSIGAAMLGASAGMVGTFVLLRKRSLVSDAISHATLPGLALAFIVMAAITGDGRSMIALFAGSALSAGLGLLAVEWIVRRTRLPEDAAIAGVLSVFFGVGIVLLTVVQTLQSGGQAGLSKYLLGSTAGMLRSEAEAIAIAGALAGLAIFILRRPFTLVCFDADYAAARAINVRRADLLMMGLVLAVTVIGLRIAGLVLIVALMIIPPVAARFWTERVERMVFIAAGVGAVSAYIGAALSASASNVPTGAIIVLVAFILFLVSMVFSPVRGLLARVIKQAALHVSVHRRQGLLAISRNERILDRATRKILVREGYMRGDGVTTEAGHAAAAAETREEARWETFRRLYPSQAEIYAHHGLEPVSAVLPPDLVAELDRQLLPRLVHP